MGVTFLTDKVAAVIEPGDHASTFAGGAVVAAAGVKVVERIAAPEFLHVRAMGARLEAGLLKMQARYSASARCAVGAALGIHVGRSSRRSTPLWRRACC